MPINKEQKEMLQFPVRKEVAKAWHEIVKVSGNSQGDLFTCIFADFLNSIRQVKKGAKKDGKEKSIA